MSVYFFDLFNLGETQVFKGCKRVNITAAAHNIKRRTGLKYKFSCVQVGADVFVTRVK